MTTAGYLRHIAFCCAHDGARFLPFWIGDTAYGEVRDEIADELLRGSDSFLKTDRGFELHPRFADYQSRTTALGRATEQLCTFFEAKPRAEMYPVINSWGENPAAEVDRIAVPWFGVRGYGVHVNGYVEKADGLYIWIAERSADRLIDPGKLDHIIAGGSPIGLSIRENLAKEAHEEANVSQDLVNAALPVGGLAYKVDRLGGLRHDTLFIFDLPLPESYRPENTDGEVASFSLLPVAEVAKIVHDTDRFKFNCNLVIVDFLLRRGLIGQDHPEHAALSHALASLREPYPAGE